MKNIGIEAWYDVTLLEIRLYDQMDIAIVLVIMAMHQPPHDMYCIFVVARIVKSVLLYFKHDW